VGVFIELKKVYVSILFLCQVEFYAAVYLVYVYFSEFRLYPIGVVSGVEYYVSGIQESWSIET
jgi:hypothetical protein